MIGVDEPGGLLELRVAGLLRGLAEPVPVPAAGSAAALAGAMAASLVTMAARSSPDWEAATAAAAQAETLRARLEPLALADAQAYADALAALRDDAPGAPPAGPALERAAELPLAIASHAADVAELAVHAASRCAASVRGEALAAAALAAGAARAAERLVAVNLRTVSGDERSERARACAEAAEDAWRRASEA